MGKFSNIVSAQITGNVGSMNFRRKDGEIVAAQRATTNSSKGDGASYAQRLHRIRIANIANVYRAIAQIEKRGWEKKDANQSDFNMFAKYNLANSPIFLTKQEAALGAAVCAPYAVSRGSLSPCNGKYVEETVFEFGLNIGQGEIDWDTMTIPEFSQRIIENNQGWQYGDKLSACVCHQITRTVSGIEVSQIEVVYLEITLDANSTQLLSDMGNWDALQLDAGNDRTLRFLDGGDAAFVIHSRETAGKLLTSEQDMVLRAPHGEVVVKYSCDAQRDAAMASYGYKDAVLLDPNSENVTSASAAAFIESIKVIADEEESDFVNGMTVASGAMIYIKRGGSYAQRNPNVMYKIADSSLGWENAEISEESGNEVWFECGWRGDYRVMLNGEVIYTFVVTE